MWLLPRVRVVLGRHPWLHPLLVGGASLLVWWQAAAAQHDAERSRRAWGSTVAVWVAEADAAPGDTIRLRREDYPSAMVPTGAVVEPPPDPTAARDVASGAVLVPADLAAPDDLPAGWSVFAVPADHAPAVRVADAVGVFAGGRLLCDGLVQAIASSAAGASGPAVEVAVPADCAPELSADLAAADVVLARHP